jgi:hypothetical protein
MTLIYIVYIILAEAESFGKSITRVVMNIVKILSNEAIEIQVKKSSLEIDLMKIVIPVAGYDTFRFMNIVNLLLPIMIFKFISSFTRNMRLKSFLASVLILGFSILGLTFIVFIQFTPYGFNALSCKVPIYFEGKDIVTVEYVETMEYPLLRPRVHVATLNYFSEHLEKNTSRIIGDKVFCTGFMYVNRRDLYTSCSSMSSALKINIEANKITKLEINAPGAFIVINYPLVFMSEEPIEYRSNILRRALIRETDLIYNSGATIIAVAR